MQFGYSKELNYSFKEAREILSDELKKEGFGVLTEINITDTFKEKIDVDFKPYVILGVCNPHLAYRALQQEDEIGLLLPCNIILYENKQGKITVSAIEPDAMMSFVSNNEIEQVAREAKQKLHTVIDML